MYETDSTLTAVFIRIMAIIIVLSLYQYWPVTTLGISMFEQVIYNYRYQEITSIDLISTGLGILYIGNWLLGIVIAISLFRLKPASRWLLLVYFAVGLFAASVSWIPYAGYIMTWFENPYLQLLSVQIPNLVIVVFVFLLFRKLAQRPVIAQKV